MHDRHDDYHFDDDHDAADVRQRRVRRYEECDGFANSNALPGGCRRDCLLDRLCGDGDGDGAVDVVDAQWVLQAAIKLVSPCPLTACDPTGDASVTVSDSQRILFNAIGLMPDLVCAFPITLRVDQTVTLGSVSFDVSYGATDESFLGEGSEVVCEQLVSGATATFVNDCDNEKLTITVAQPAGFTGPGDLAECRFRAVSAKPSPTAFSINVGGATADGNPFPPALSLDY
jgi:hypothetical protein